MKDARLDHALLVGLELSKSGQREEARQLMGEVIAEAISQRDDLTVAVLTNHAALLDGTGRDLYILKHYRGYVVNLEPEFSSASSH